MKEPTKLKKFLLSGETLRQSVPGLSEPVYVFAEYLGKNIDEDVNPNKLVICIVCALSDIEQSRNGFHNGNEFPEFLASHKFETKIQAKYILQIIDEVMDEEYANEVRRICKDVLKWDNVPKICKTPSTTKGDYAPEIIAATNWWRKELLNPNMDNGEPSMAMLMALFGSSFTHNDGEQVAKYCDKLADVLQKEMERGVSILYMRSEYGPDRKLSEALEEGVRLNFPQCTDMEIAFGKYVRVSRGYGAKWEMIYTA